MILELFLAADPFTGTQKPLRTPFCQRFYDYY